MTTDRAEIRSRATDPPLPASFLETYAFEGNTAVKLKTDLRPDGFEYGQTLEMASSQLRHFKEHPPIRVAAMTLTFDITHRTIWHKAFLHNRIRAHHQYAIAVPQPQPMVLFLAPLYRVFRGFIEEVDAGEKRHQAAY